MSISYFYNELSNALISGGQSFVRATLLTLLTIQLAARLPQYQWNEDYLTRPLPLMMPYLFVFVPDNACLRYYFSPPIGPLTYDFIIVGSGPTGSVIANRLSQKYTVMLIEAGDNPITESTVPMLFPFDLNNTRTWNYTASVVNSSANAFKNGCSFASGKMLGGSTGMNAMLYACGTDRDYNQWGINNPGWDYATVKNYIKQSENNKNSTIVNYKPGYHATGGPLSIDSYSSIDTFNAVLQASVNEAGYTQFTDYNSGEYNGFGTLQGTLNGGERCSAASAFLVPIRSNPNLFIVKNSLATNLLYTNTSGVISITGVSFKTSSATCPTIKVYARKEVIVSAGSIGTPKLLLQSGIGRLVDLQPFGIKQIADLAVGNNLQDHVLAVTFFKVRDFASALSGLEIVLQGTDYLFSRTGPMVSLGTVSFGGFINTVNKTDKYSDIQYIFYRFEKSQQDFGQILANFGYKDQYMATILDANKGAEILLVFTILLNPKSRGTVKLQSSNPLVNPLINSGFLNHVDDRNTLLKGIRELQKITTTPTMLSNNVTLLRFSIPECDSITFDSDPYWQCYFKYFTTNLWHPCGTSKMGPASDTEAVVDEKLQVKKVKKLRVADASIMPTLISSNTQCTCYMIGQKAADMILQANP